MIFLSISDLSILFLENRRLILSDQEELMNQRISLAYDAREAVKSDWGKGYWDAVLAYLLRQANRLN